VKASTKVFPNEIKLDFEYTMNIKNSILFLGDVVPYKPFKFRNSHQTVFNLECPITKDGNPAKEKINIRVKENYLQNIFNSNILCVSLGNNHILDYGEKGLDSTLKELEKSNINYFGLNTGNDDNFNPLVLELNNIKIAFISVVCQTASPVLELDNVIYLSSLNLNEIINRVLKIRKLVNRVVVSIHWGEEESSYPKKEDIFIARKLIDGGVDLIIGSHAHAPQPIEKYKNGVIAYNLGNFLMPEMKNIPTYFDEKGLPLSTYSKNLMMWNRISWGLIIDMENMEYKIKKFIFLFDRIIELPFTPLDKYIELKQDLFNASYELIVKNHLKKRDIYRKIIEFIYKPHIPEKLKKIL
jgi:Bacterial capsule synthesis protein PGA_cap